MIRESHVQYPARFQQLGMRAKPTVEIDAKTMREYSLARALRVAMGAEPGTAGPERDISDALMRLAPQHDIKSGLATAMRNFGDFAIPTAVLWGQRAARAVDTTNTGSKGSNLIFTRPGEFVAPLRPRSVALALGATFLEGAPLPMDLPIQTTAPDAEWVSDNPGSDYSDTDDVTLGRVPFGVKTLTANTAYTLSLLAQSRSSTAVDGLIADDLRARFGTAVDRAAINSTDANGPTGGILQNGDLTVIGIGTNGGVPTYDAITALEEAVALNDGDNGNLGFATTPQIRRKLRKTERAAGSGFVWDRGGRVLDQPGAVSTVVPSSLDKGTSTGVCHAIIYGDWSSLVIATAEAVTILADPFAGKKQGLVEIQAFNFMDLGVRQGKKFAAILDATLS